MQEYTFQVQFDDKQIACSYQIFTSEVSCRTDYIIEIAGETSSSLAFAIEGDCELVEVCSSASLQPGLIKAVRDTLNKLIGR